MAIQVCVPREIREGERRVALVPDAVKRLVSAGVQVSVESGAGEGIGCADAGFERAAIIGDGGELLRRADVLLVVNPPTAGQIERLREGAVLIGFLDPHADPGRFGLLAARRVSALAMELVPRISRAQAMDALSSQASAAGYKAVLIAGGLSGKFFPMLTTAAGTVRPSKVLVIGAGVAGLQAIATARRLGAMVEGYDVRAEVREQVESLGARFVDIEVKAEGAGGYARELTDEEKRRQREILARHVAGADAIITTAAIPGRPAPRVIDRGMVESMRGGSVIVDLAAESGGNCELTRAGETLTHRGVAVHGPVNVPSMLAVHASELYAKNLLNLLDLMIRDGEIVIDLDDEIINESLVTHAGRIHHAGVKARLEGAET